jgi:small subunit ribosomal protein S6
MQPYEVMVMIDPEAEESRQDEIIDRIRQHVEQTGGTFESVDAWGRRKLAYEIDHKSEAFYHVVAFTSTPEALAEITRVLKITDDVVRHMATRRSLRSSGPVEESVPVA